MNFFTSPLLFRRYKNNNNSHKIFFLTSFVETFVTSEIHKLGVVTQREVVDAEGNVKRETIPPEKWDADLASTSEEIVKAERHEDHKGPLNMKDLQDKSLKRLLEKDQKMSTAKPSNQ